MGKYIRAAIAKTGLYAFERTWDSGMRQISNVIRPINVPADLKGMRLRVPQAPVLIALFKALGGAPTPLDSNAVYVALQSHLIDGVENPNYILETSKLFETLKYVSITNHVWTGLTIIANGDAWQRLPKNLRDIVEHYFSSGAVLEREDVRREDFEYEAQLKQQGLIYNKPDLASFRAAVRAAGLFAQWRSSFGDEAWAALEKSVGALT